MGEFSFESDAFNQVTQVLNDLELKIHKSDSGLGILEDVWSKIQCNPDVIQEAKNVVVIGDQCASLVRRIKLAMETSSFEIPEVLEVRRHVDDLHDRMMIKDHLETELKAVVSRVLATELLTAQNKREVITMALPVPTPFLGLEIGPNVEDRDFTQTVKIQLKGGGQLNQYLPNSGFLALGAIDFDAGTVRLEKSGETMGLNDWLHQVVASNY